MSENQKAFEMFCRMHPHEAYAQDPDRFVAYVQYVKPGFSREEIVTCLHETEEQEAPTKSAEREGCEK